MTGQMPVYVSFSAEMTYTLQAYSVWCDTKAEKWAWADGGTLVSISMI